MGPGHSFDDRVDGGVSNAVVAAECAAAFASRSASANVSDFVGCQPGAAGGFATANRLRMDVSAMAVTTSGALGSIAASVGTKHHLCDGLITQAAAHEAWIAGISPPHMASGGLPLFHVPHVVLMRPESKVVGPDAAPVVAIVEDVEAALDAAMEHFPNDTMGAGALVVDPDSRVAGAGERAGPVPAMRWFWTDLEARPHPIREWCRAVGVHTHMVPGDTRREQEIRQ